MELPTLEQSIDQLKVVSSLEDFDPDTPLLQSEADSLDLMEWLYAMQERYPDFALDESIFEDIDDTVTFRVIYDQGVAASSVAS